MKLEKTIKEIEALIRLSKDKRFDIKIRDYEINLLEDLLNHITKQEKMIDKMVHWISDRCLYVDDYINGCDVIQDSCYEWQCGKDCKECIKQYFEKKAEENK